MSRNWHTTTVGESCAIFSGGTPAKSNAHYWLGDIPWVSAKDLKFDQISESELHISSDACKDSSTKMAEVGSLLVLVRGMGLANGVPMTGSKRMKILPAQFDGQDIRRVHDEATDTWWFSVVDVVQILTQHADFQAARKYWNQLKRRLKNEGSESVTACHRLKLPAADGKKYLTDVATAQTLLRLVQSIPSPKAEPIKLWLAKVGYERMQEMADPALSLDRARETWKRHGRSEKWIAQRMTGQETRNKLTDYWREHEVQEGQEFAILTNIIHQEWSGVDVKDHKALKGLKSQNLRDHMSEAELIFTALAELSTRQIAEKQDATGLPENKVAAQAGGRIARSARRALEDQTGKSVVTGSNYLPPARIKALGKGPKP